MVFPQRGQVAVRGGRKVPLAASEAPCHARSLGRDRARRCERLARPQLILPWGAYGEVPPAIDHKHGDGWVFTVWTNGENGHGFAVGVSGSFEFASAEILKASRPWPWTPIKGNLRTDLIGADGKCQAHSQSWASARPRFRLGVR